MNNEIENKIKKLEEERDSLLNKTPYIKYNKHSNSHSKIKAFYNRKINSLKKYGVESYYQTDEGKRALKERLNTPQMKEKRSVNIKKAYQREDVRNKQKEGLIRQRNNEAFRNLLSTKIKEAYQKEEVKQAQLNGIHNMSQQVKENRNLAISKAIKRVWEDPEKREELTNLRKEIANRENMKNYRSSFFTNLYHNMGKEKKNERIDKIFQTKRENGSLNISKQEDEIYEVLNKIFKSVKRQYKNDLYPFMCDFYIEDIDTYIEVNFHTFTHGNHPYDENSKIDLNRLKLLEEKYLKTGSLYYKNAINVWVKRDPLKLKIAAQNKLNYKVFYNIEQFNNWIKQYVSYNKNGGDR